MVITSDGGFLLYVNTHYNNILLSSKETGEYTEFKDRYNELISTEPLDKHKCESFLCNFFKKVLENKINDVLSYVSKNQKLVYNIHREVTTLSEIKTRLLLHDLKLEDLYKLKVEMNKELSSMIIQRELIILTRKEQWKERVIGIVIGIIASLIAYGITN